MQDRVVALVASMIVLPSCGISTHATHPIAAPSETLVRHGRVVLPAGVAFAPGTLRVVNSLGSHVVASDGSFDVVAYRGGPQFTLVTNDAGDPVLAGFVGPTQTIVDTTSTAKLLSFFAAGAYALPLRDRTRTLDALAMAPGFPRVVRALAATLRTDATALGRPTDSDDPFSTALDRFVTTDRPIRSTVLEVARAHPLVPAIASQARRFAIRRLLRTFLVPLVGAVLVPIDSPAIDAMANDETRRAPVAGLADLVLRNVPSISTFVDENRTGDALIAAYTSIVDSDTAQAALFAMVRDGHDTSAGRSNGKALYDTASSIFATWDVLGSAFTPVPAAVVSERVATSR